MSDRVNPVVSGSLQGADRQSRHPLEADLSSALGRAERRGGKAVGLDCLQQHQDLGFEVPRYEVLDLSWFEAIQRQQLMARFVTQLSRRPHIAARLPAELQEHVQSLAERYLGKVVIVRSNSQLEDGEHSFAGRYDSVIVRSVSSETLTGAILQVYASLDGPRALRFREEFGIAEDKMGVVVQEYIEGDYSGVMFTSNPDYPGDLSIEIGSGPGAIVNAEKAAVSAFDYDKAGGVQVYGKDALEIEQKGADWLEQLHRIGPQLEQRTGQVEIEFCVKAGRIYFVQLKHLRHLSSPDPDLELPPNNQRKLLGTSHCARGQGIFILPVVKVDDPGVVAGENPLFDLPNPFLTLADMGRQAGLAMPGWFAGLERANKEFADGYILLTPHFHETCFEGWALTTGRNLEDNFHTLTPNKQVVLTTEHATRGSHIMDLARAGKVAYAGFPNSPEIFRQLETGDIVAVHFKGREADIYLEDTSARESRFVFGAIAPEKVQIIIEDDGKAAIKINLPVCKPEVIFDGIGQFLERLTGEKWTFHAHGHMDCAFVDSSGTGIGLSGFAYSGISQQYQFHNRRLFFVAPVPKRISAAKLARVEAALLKELSARGVR